MQAGEPNSYYAAATSTSQTLRLSLDLMNPFLGTKTDILKIPCPMDSHTQEHLGENLIKIIRMRPRIHSHIKPIQKIVLKYVILKETLRFAYMI